MPTIFFIKHYNLILNLNYLKLYIAEKLISWAF